MIEFEGVGPNLNETLEIRIGNEAVVGKDLHGGRTSVVARVEPALNTGTVVGDAGDQTDGRLHEVKRNWANEMSGNSQEEIVGLDHGDETVKLLMGLEEERIELF